MASEVKKVLMARLVKYTLPLLVLLSAWAVAHYFKSSKPEPEKRPSPASVLSVEATRLQATEYPVLISSQGTVKATQSNALVPEVAGKVIWISPDFVKGGRFKEQQVLLRIDSRDYEIALTQAKANLAEAQARLLEQNALAERAEEDWLALGRRGAPSSLTLRKPQLAAAEASRDAAAAQVERARLDLQRTRIVSPYEGIVSEKSVSSGQFVSIGAALGQIYSLRSVDVVLPLSNRQLTHLQLPLSSVRSPTEVELQATIGAMRHTWKGQLIRTEGLDAITQQLNLIAQVQNPLTHGSVPLRVGQFVQAQIRGKILQQVYVIPRSALREEREVLLVDEDQTLRRQAVGVAWSDDHVAAIDQGLENGALLVTTPLSTVSEGTPVIATVDGVPPDRSSQHEQPSGSEQSIN